MKVNNKIVLFLLVFVNVAVKAQCPPGLAAGFTGQDTSGALITFPYTTTCDDNQTYMFVAWDSAAANGYIVPYFYITVNPTNSNTDNEMHFYVGGSYLGGFYPGSPSGNVPANTNFTGYISYISPTGSDWQIELCDPSSGTDMTYTVYDGASGAVIVGPGTWTATDVGSGGPGGTSCQTITVPASSITGSAVYTCPSCPPGSFLTGDWGGGYFNPAAAGPGTYTFTYTWNDGQGCVVSASNTITVVNPYDATFNYSSTSYCQNAADPTPTVTQSGGTFSSTPAGLVINATTGTIDVSASTPGTYTVQYDRGYGTTSVCGDTKTQTVTIVAPPDAGTNGSVTLCNTGSSVNLFSYLGGTPDSGGSWTDPNGNPHSGTLNPATDPSGNYTYTVAGTAPCANATATVSVTVNTQPNAGTNGSGIYCSSDPTVSLISLLGGSPDTGGSWTDPNGNPHSGTLNPATDPSGTYTYTIAGAAPCTNVSSTVSITINQAPTVSISGTTTVCQGATPSLTATIGGTASSVTWSSSGDGTFSSTTSLTTVYTPGTNDVASGNVVITVTTDDPAGPCNAATDNVTLTINPLPVADAGADDTLTCSATSITLDGTGSSSGANYSYNWTSPNGNIVSGATTLTPVVNQIGTYILTVTNTTTGCSSTDTVDVFQDASVPVANAGADTALTCSVSTIVLDGSGSSQGTNYTYSWTTSNGNIVSGANTLTPTIDSTGTYTLTVTNTANGCSATDVVTVTIDTVKPVADAGSPMEVTCAVSSVTLDGSASSANAVYSWTTSNGNIISGGTTLTPVVDAAGTYMLTVTNPVNGCSAIDSVVVTADTVKPVANAGIDTVITCTNDTLTLIASGSTGNNYVYQWTGTGNIISGDTTLNPVIVSGGTYILTVTDTSNGCSVTDTVIVSEDLIAVALINANPTSGLVPLDVDLTASGSNGTVSWDLGDGTTSSDVSLTHTYNDLGEYVVLLTVTTPGGCTASDSITIEVFGNSTLIFPNVFTPNGDGKNDIFYFKAENMESLECTIFNRWGQLMYSWSTPKGYWDGRTTAGKEAPAGTYFFTMKAKGLDGKEYDQKGSFILIR